MGEAKKMSKVASWLSDLVLTERDTAIKRVDLVD